MMNTRSVKQTLYATLMDMGGLPVRQALPGAGVDMIDPFLLLHHSAIPARTELKAMHQGVPPHPHRGFDPVTVVLSGEVHHRDSLGNSSVVGPGGVQWIRAGRGIVHSERPSEHAALRGMSTQVIQLWINVPASAKMESPWYKPLQPNEIPSISLGNGADLRLIAGRYGQHTGPIVPASELLLARIDLNNDAEALVTIPNGHNAAIYVAEGSGTLKGHRIAEQFQMLYLNNDGEHLQFRANGETTILIMTGKPIDEPVAHYGPFVMNTQTEIMQALRDYQMGKMGVLIEEP